VHFIVDLGVARPVESNATIVQRPDNTITVLSDKRNIMLIFDFGPPGLDGLLIELKSVQFSFCVDAA
jgi:hypothetical protein